MAENVQAEHARHMRKRQRLAKRVSLLRIAAEAAQHCLQHDMAADAKEILNEALVWLSSDVESERVEHAGIAFGMCSEEMVCVGYTGGKFIHKMVRRGTMK